MNTDPKDLAFPLVSPISDPYHTGLTKREYFAALAMQGLCANHLYEGMTPAQIATECVNQADALIAALNASTL